MVRDKRNMVILSHDNLEVVTFLETLVPYIVNRSVPRLAETIERIFIISILRNETGVFPLLLYPVKSCLLILRIEVSQNHHRKFLHIPSGSEAPPGRSFLPPLPYGRGEY